VQRIVNELLRDAVQIDEPVLGPAAVTVLLREYAASGRDDCREAVEHALAEAVGAGTATSPEWLEALVEAASLSDDARLQEAIDAAIAAQRREWARSPSPELVARSVRASLIAASASNANSLASEAVDELEKLIGARYRPGAGLQPPHGEARLVDQVTTAAALLTAFEISARLPYAMLAEELVRFSQRALLPASFDASCALARVLCRLASMNENVGYRQAAITTVDASYRRDAAVVLERLEADCENAGPAAALFALAAGEYLADQN
jgi:hypothetical protein